MSQLQISVSEILISVMRNPIYMNGKSSSKCNYRYLKLSREQSEYSYRYHKLELCLGTLTSQELRTSRDFHLGGKLLISYSKYKKHSMLFSFF